MLDLVIVGGDVADGTGRRLRRADVGIAGDQIAIVEDPARELATRRIDATGLVVSPGFVDMHAHSELSLLRDPEHVAKVAQGVTLEVLGQDGLSYAPINEATGPEIHSKIRAWNGDLPAAGLTWQSVADLLDRLDGTAVNVAYLVPHGNVRILAMGFDDRSPSSSELEAMRSLVARSLDEGAFGMSTGLTYAPAMYADDDELIALCQVVADHGSLYVPHHRNYGAGALEAYADCFRIAEAAGADLHLAHAHLGYATNKGRAGELIELIDVAQARGRDVTLDSYPYLAGSSYLHAFLPGWIQGAPTDEMISRLQDPIFQRRLRIELEQEGTDGSHGVPVDWATIVLSGVTETHHRQYTGLSIAEIAARMQVDPFDAYLKLVINDRLGSSCIVHVGNEENVRDIIRHPRHMAGSDGLLVGETPHPRAFGTFPRYLGRYVRDLEVIGLAEMLRHMTDAPCRRLGLLDRGRIAAGFFADIVCFDPETVRDRATYENPRQLPDGIPFVLVNGQLVIEDGRHTGRRPGRVVRSRVAVQHGPRRGRS